MSNNLTHKKELKKRKSVIIDKNLDQYTGIDLFPEKTAKAAKEIRRFKIVDQLKKFEL